MACALSLSVMAHVANTNLILLIGLVDTRMLMLDFLCKSRREFYSARLGESLFTRRKVSTRNAGRAILPQGPEHLPCSSNSRTHRQSAARCRLRDCIAAASWTSLQCLPPMQLLLLPSSPPARPMDQKK